MDEEFKKFRECCAKHLKEINWQLEDIRWRVCALISNAENQADGDESRPNGESQDGSNNLGSRVGSVSGAGGGEDAGPFHAQILKGGGFENESKHRGET